MNRIFEFVIKLRDDYLSPSEGDEEELKLYLVLLSEWDDYLSPSEGDEVFNENTLMAIATGMITYLRVKETKTFIDQFFKVYYFLMITYLRVKETKTSSNAKLLHNILLFMMITYLRVKETKTTVIQ